MPLAAGTRLGPYEILAPLGAGGMGEVYRAHDTRLGRDIALKLLREDVQSSPQRLARFEREARSVAGLSHPNIVVLYSIEDFDGRIGLVLELIEGRDLSELVTSGGLPLAQVLDLAIPLAEALASAHEKGIVHRDLKPANIKVSREGRLKVLDFGLARMLEAEPGLGLTRTVEAPMSEAGVVMGTVPYMAPEQIRGDVVDARADLFAFGVIVYELATGKRPFTGPSLADVSSSILRDAPAPLGEVRSEVPPELGRIVDRCLAKNPRERFQSALDLANDLRRVAVGKPTSSPTRPAGEVSIAVLPFANRSANPEDEYFAEGLADELLGVLARIRGIRVAARTSSGRFKNTTEDLPVIGQKLNVATLLEGSVRKAGNRVRIGVQLVRVADGDAVWSQTYDRTLDDVFAAQDDIAHAVVKELRRALLGEADDSDASREAKAEVARATRHGRSKDPEAQRLLLQARHIGDRRTAQDAVKAIELLEQALAMDPSFAGAWTELSRHHHRLANELEGDEGSSHKRKAKAAIERALELDPELAGTYGQYGFLQLFYDLDWKSANASLRRGLALDPEDPRVLNLAGLIAQTEGRFDDAERLFLECGKSDPLSPASYVNRGIALMWSARHEAALEAFRKAIELAPGAIGAHYNCAQNLVALGRMEEARDEIPREVHPAYRLLAEASFLEGETADHALQELIALHAREASAQIAHAYASRGDVENAFAWLERAKIERDPGIMQAVRDPNFRSLHPDPRWKEIMRWLGLEPGTA